MADNCEMLCRPDALHSSQNTEDITAAFFNNEFQYRMSNELCVFCVFENASKRKDK